MRVPWSGVRLASLAIAATASGYLWRAAFEPSQAPVIIRVAPPALRSAIPAAPAHLTHPSGRVAPKLAGRHVAARRHQRPTTYVLASAAAPAPHTYAPAPAGATPKPRQKPAPTPKPPTPPAPPAGPPAPEAAPASTPPATQQPTQPPSEEGTNEATETGKPGWGHGDTNHDHGGPPGGKHG